MKNFLIIGCGLLGGKIGLLIKQNFKDSFVAIVDRFAEKELILKHFDCIFESPTQSEFKQKVFDLAIIATPILEINQKDDILPFLATSKKVMDVWSTKQYSDIFFKEVEQKFIPSHPIAGNHLNGFTGALLTENFLDKKKCIICKSGTDFDFATKFWEKLGMNCEYLDAKVHDEIYAFVSHFPQALAFALKNILKSFDENLPFFRLTKSNFNVWRMIFLTNKENILAVLEKFEKEFEEESSTEDFAIICKKIFASIVPEIYLKYAGTGLESITMQKKSLIYKKDVLLLIVEIKNILLR